VRRIALSVIACWLFAVTPAGASHRPVVCSAPAETARLNSSLPNTARAIRHGQALTVVAIGSSSTAGVGASDEAHAYPARLADEMRRRWPLLSITVVNKGVGGETAEQMLARFGRDVLPFRPQLVIWQMGSNRALKGGSLAQYAETVRRGVRRLRAARSDVVLMDPQYAPRVIAKPMHRRILNAIGTIGDDLKVAVFHRFALMRHWVTSGEHRIEDMIARDRLHMNDASYGCIARLLADALAQAARTGGSLTAN
jgi:lysophospholipase L1-like esterase